MLSPHVGWFSLHAFTLTCWLADKVIVFHSNLCWCPQFFPLWNHVKPFPFHQTVRPIPQQIQDIPSLIPWPSPWQLPKSCISMYILWFAHVCSISFPVSTRVDFAISDHQCASTRWRLVMMEWVASTRARISSRSTFTASMAAVKSWGIDPQIPRKLTKHGKTITI